MANIKKLTDTELEELESIKDNINNIIPFGCNNYFGLDLSKVTDMPAVEVLCRAANCYNSGFPSLNDSEEEEISKRCNDIWQNISL